MAQASLLTDDLLRHLIAVGQVDVVVGVPTLNNAETITAALRAADEGLSKHFPRERTVILCADGGSRDGTPEIVTALSSEVVRKRDGASGLRTRHRTSTSYGGVPGRAAAVRLIFAAADLLQARAVAVLDPEVTSLTPAWIGALVGPVSKQSFDFVAPRYDRHPLEGTLLTQLLRPLIRETYGRQVDEPLIGEFGCSGRFATHCLAENVWDSGPIRAGIELWLTGTALAGDFRACQTRLGPRVLAPGQPRPALRDVFPPIVGSLFACLDLHAEYWVQQQASEPLPVFGSEEPYAESAPSLDPARLGESFGRDVRHIRPILESILAAETFAGLWALADSGNADSLRYPDVLWVATVHDFLAAYRVGVMDRAHIAQALMPLYLGRVASFLTQHATAEPPEVVEDIERLARQFKQGKPYLIERWNRTTLR